MTISKTGYYDSTSQRYYFIGEIKNIGNTAETDITINITAYDSLNNTVDIETPTPEITVLNAGAKSPFYAYCESSQASQKVDHFDATILTSNESSALQVGIQITVDNATLNGTSSSIIGTLRNTSQSETDMTEIYAIFYDSNGKVIGLGYDQSDVLEPNDTSHFNVTSEAFVPNAIVGEYAITAESFTYERAGPQGLYISTETTGGTIPEFSADSAMLLVLTVMSALMLFIKKQQARILRT